MATANGGFSSECVIDDCFSVVVAKSLCNKHYLRLRYNGDPNVTLYTRHDRLTYNTAHHRVYSAKGKAAEQSCADCGADAHHWSFTECSDQMSEDQEWGGAQITVSYCGHPEHYEARCRACHIQYDKRRV